MCNLSEYIEERGIKTGIEMGIAQGMEKGMEKGMDQLNNLYSWLLSQERVDDVKTATTDPAYQKQLFAEMEAATR